MLKRLTNKATWLGGIAGGIFVQWSMVVGVSFLLGLTVFADSYTLSNTGMTSYQHVVQNGGGVTEISNTYTVDVPAGMAAKVTLVESGSGFVWHGCETSTFHQMVNGSYQTLQNRTTEFLSTATIKLAITCSPAVSWTEIYEIGHFSIAGAEFPHYGSKYHFYENYYAKMNYCISVSYERLLSDLVVSSISLSSTDAAVDETVTLTYTVKNAGRKNATNATVVRIYDGDRQICGDQTVSALSVGATSTKTVTLPKLSAGKHTLKVVADALNAIEESYEGNNESTVSLRDYTRTPVDVTFDTNGGSEARSGTVIAGDAVGSLPVPFRKGYEFDGWWTELAGGYQIDANEKVTMARTFYARWNAKNSLIAFNQQGGGIPTTVQAAFGEPLPMVAVPVREGHAFNGYWTGVGGTGTQYYSEDGRGVREWECELPEVVLYAKWTGMTGELRFDAQGGSGGSRSTSVTFECAMPTIVPPTRSGWLFQGYYSSPNGKGLQYYAESGAGARIWDQINESAVTLYAHWLPIQNTCNLTLDKQNGSGGTVAVTAFYDAAMPQIEIPYRDQYVFEGYYSEPNGGGTKYYTAGGESACKWNLAMATGKLYAKWSKAYRVRLEPNGGSGSARYSYFTEQEWHLMANPYSHTGFVFAGWSFEPDGAPVLPDGARVNKGLFGYGDDPDATAVTLYAIWGKPLTTSLFPGMDFVTGGDCADACWRVDSGMLRSGTSGKVSWLCLKFENSGDLQYTFANNVTWKIQHWQYHDLALQTDFIWAADDTIYTNQCNSDSVDVKNVAIESGFRLATWSCIRDVQLQDWCGVEPTYDKNVLAGILSAQMKAYEEKLPTICAKVGQLLRKASNSWSEADDKQVETVLRLEFERYKLGSMPAMEFDNYLLPDIANKGYNVSYLRTELSSASSLSREIHELENSCMAILVDIAELEDFFNGYGSVRELEKQEFVKVGFLLDGGVNYQRAKESSNRIFDKNNEFESAFRSVLNQVAEVLKPLNTSYYYPWTEDDDRKVKAVMELEIARYKNGGMPRPTFCDYVLEDLANKGFNIKDLRKIHDEERYTSSGGRLYSLYIKMLVILDEIEELEGAVLQSGVLQWKSVAQGHAIGTLLEPEPRYGYDFVGWWTSAEKGSKVLETTTFNSDTPVYAHWEKITHELSFITGTSAGYDRRILDYDEPIGELPTPVREGYTFGGWTYLDGGKAASILDHLSADATLVANWTKDAVWTDVGGTQESGWMLSVTFDANGGSVDMTTCGRNTGDTVGALPIPVQTGYQFDGWFTAKAGGDRVSETTVVHADVTYYAHWTVNTYTIRFVANGGSGTMADQTLIYDVAQMLSANRFKCEGMHFLGWATSEHGAVVYKNRAEVKNLTAEQGGLVCLYAVWEDGSEGLNPNDPVGAIGSNESAPYASVATTYDGYLYGEDDIVVGSVQVKVAKGKVDRKSGLFSAKVTATVQLAGDSKKISFKGGVADAAGMVTGLTAKGHSLEVSLGVNGLGGTFDGKYQIDGARNVFTAKDAEAKSVAAAVDSDWAGKAINIVSGGDVLTVAIGKKGKVKVSGMVNGVKVSATSQLLVGETCCCIPVVITKKANFAFTLWLDDGGIDVVGLDGGAVADTARPLKAGAKFNIGDAGAALLAALGGKGTLYGEYLPDGLSVAQSGKKWIVADGAKAGKVMVNRKTGEIDEAKHGVNPSGLKLTYTEKSGSFKGSFKVYNLENGKVKSYTVNVTGVMIGDVGYGTATLKKPACSFPISIK